MAVLKRFKVLSVGKIYAILAGIWGLIEGLIFTTIYAVNPAYFAGDGIFTKIGYAGVLVFPILYAVMGFVGGVFFSWLYNAIAGWVGGVEFTLELEKKKK